MKELLAPALGSPDLINDTVDRLETFAHPFSATMPEADQRQRQIIDISGLLSKRDHKSAKVSVHADLYEVRVSRSPSEAIRSKGQSGYLSNALGDDNWIHCRL